MSQHLFASETSPSLANLDANFIELYNRVVSYSIKSLSPLYDSMPAVLGATSIGGVGSAGGFRLGFGLNVSHDGSTWRTGTDGGSNGGAALLCSYGSGNLEFHVVPSTGAASQSIANGSMTAKMSLSSGGILQPGGDNAQTLGAASLRWSTVYAGTGTINTSDAREKTAVVAMTAGELAAAKELCAAIGTYKWLAAVQAKGADARSHVGLTVQSAMAIMTTHGLDPMAYGFICYDAWPAVAEIKNDEGVIVQASAPAGDRFAFRPDELGMFIARGVAASLVAIEARLTAAGF